MNAATPVPSPAPELTPDEAPEIPMTAIYAAVKVVARTLGDRWLAVPPDARYDLRQDLQQDLALKVATGKLGLAGLRIAAINWLKSEIRSRRTRLETEASYDAGTGRRYRVGSLWEPNWYPPHPDAEQFCPLSVFGARMMSVRGRAPSEAGVDGEATAVYWTSGPINVEDATIDWVDSLHPPVRK